MTRARARARARATARAMTTLDAGKPVKSQMTRQDDTLRVFHVGIGLVLIYN
jgi:hypothetical protein